MRVPAMTIKLVPIENGSIEIPNELRERYGFEDGSLLVMEADAEGIVLRPTDWPEPEIYTPERIAEFLLNGAVNESEYRAAIEKVKRMGIDPSPVPHDPF
jgi:bifunctional DNA-binding transcriptional regulator/antitoxin component of YhaV-PrlF toxin-antitoxin module